MYIDCNHGPVLVFSPRLTNNKMILLSHDIILNEQWLRNPRFEFFSSEMQIAVRWYQYPHRWRETGGHDRCQNLTGYCAEVCRKEQLNRTLSNSGFFFVSIYSVLVSARPVEYHDAAGSLPFINRQEEQIPLHLRRTSIHHHRYSTGFWVLTR